MDHPSESAQADAKIEITPAMIEAGVYAAREFPIGGDLREMARSVQCRQGQALVVVRSQSRRGRGAVNLHNSRKHCVAMLVGPRAVSAHSEPPQRTCSLPAYGSKGSPAVSAAGGSGGRACVAGACGAIAGAGACSVWAKSTSDRAISADPTSMKQPRISSIPRRADTRPVSIVNPKAATAIVSSIVINEPLKRASIHATAASIAFIGCYSVQQSSRQHDPVLPQPLNSMV